MRRTSSIVGVPAAVMAAMIWPCLRMRRKRAFHTSLATTTWYTPRNVIISLLSPCVGVFILPLCLHTESVSALQATNQKCAPEHECGTCYENGTCVAITKYTRWFASEFGSLQNEAQMMVRVVVIELQNACPCASLTRCCVGRDLCTRSHQLRH